MQKKEERPLINGRSVQMRLQQTVLQSTMSDTWDACNLSNNITIISNTI